MTDPYKTLERQLGDAVRRRAPHTTGRRGKPWSRGVLPAIAALAVLGTGAATAAVVLGPDDQPRNQVKQALFAGDRAAQASPACQRVKPGSARLIEDPVPAAIRDQLGVLRRPPTTTDRVPSADLGQGDVLARSIRVAQAEDGWRYQLFLKRGAQAFAPTNVTDPLACAQIRHDASVAAAADFDADVRARVAARADQRLAYTKELDSGRALLLEINELRRDGRLSSGGAVTIQGNKVPATGSVGQRIPVGNRVLVSISGLVHDGVDTVRLIDKSGPRRARPVTTPVSDNVFHVLVPRQTGPRITAQWRAPGGAIIRRVSWRTR
jgi:hypothetical protein